MWVESCIDMPDSLGENFQIECNRMDEVLSDQNDSVTYTIDKNWYTWEDQHIVIQLKNHSDNTGSRIAVPLEHLSSLNDRIIRLLSNPWYPYSNSDLQTIFSQTSPHEVVEKLEHVWLIS